MERTLSIIKPDGVAKGLIGEVIKRFEGAGLKIIAMKMIHLSKKEAEGFYSVHRDKGFYESREQIENLSRKIDTVSICKKGRRTEKEDRRESAGNFKAGQRFRAGIEGTISVLKRAFKLGRCFFKGFKNFASSVGCAVFCHNLVMLAQT